MAQAPTKKKSKKVVTDGIAHIHATFNNTIVMITDRHGNASASRKFSPMFDKKISESTVRSLKSVYQKEMKKMKWYLFFAYFI
jgi:ribosomal protein S11